MTPQYTILELRTFFQASNATFTYIGAIQLALTGKKTDHKMQDLHKLALEEIEKENPDMLIIDNLLAQMESLAEMNKIITTQ